MPCWNTPTELIIDFTIYLLNNKRYGTGITEEVIRGPRAGITEEVMIKRLKTINKKTKKYAFTIPKKYLKYIEGEYNWMEGEQQNENCACAESGARCEECAEIYKDSVTIYSHLEIIKMME